MGTDRERIERALAAIDRANAADPNQLDVRGELRPKELAHAALATEWIERLATEPSAELRIAARAHHLRRWEIPRSDFPAGRAGYHRWRKALQAFHAETTATLLRAENFDEAFTERVGALIRKVGLGRDAEVQALEDALCLVFLETQLASTAAKLGDDDKAFDVLLKTVRKMSPAARQLAGELPLGKALGSLVERAVAAAAARD